MIIRLKIALLLHAILEHQVLSTPFPCSVYNSLLSRSATGIALNIDYTFGNSVLAASTGGSFDPNLRSIDALANLCKCSSFSVAGTTVRQQDITSLIIVNQKINASHLSNDKPLNCLTGLTSLDLSGNAFLDALPDSTFAYQTNLLSLYMDNCRISVIASSLFNPLTKLQLLSLRLNQFWTLPSDFLSGIGITSLYLDDNLSLQWIPSSLITSHPSFSLSLYRTPSLSCVPNLQTQIPSNQLHNCTNVLSNEELYSGDSLSCQQISVRFSSIWDDVDLSTSLSEFVTDISLALSLDSSRIVNPAATTSSGRTTATFQVLPRLREGQLAPEQVAGRLKEQLQIAQPYSMLKAGVMTNWLTAISLVDSTSIQLKYCPAMAMFTAINSCHASSGSDALFDITSPIFLAIVLAGTAVIVIIISMTITCAIQRKKKQLLQNPSTISIMGTITAATDSKNSSRQYDLSQGRALSAMTLPAAELVHIPSYQQARAQSAIPALQYHTSPSGAISPRFDDRSSQRQLHDPVNQQQHHDPSNQQRSASVKPRGRKKTKKWDADRLANPWIAKEENQSDDDDFW